MRYTAIIIAYLLGGMSGFLIAGLFMVRTVNRMEREGIECSVCGHLPYHHGGKHGDECDACLDGMCGGGFIPLTPRR